MGSSASLDRPELAVEPGQQVSAQLRVRNNGTVVDQFTFEGLGAGAAWIEAEPEVLSLFPGAEGTVTIHFRPPRSPNTVPGPTPFGVKVVSGEDPMGSAVEEGVITVGRFADRSVEIYPLTARGRRKGQFEIAVDNRGNAPIEVEFSGADPENACAYAFASQSLIVEPGTAHFTKFDVIPHERFWKGPPKTHQFQILVTERARASELPAPVLAGPPGSPPPPVTAPVPVTPPPETINGTLLQEAMIPPWLIKAIIALIALIVLLWILWFTLFKPTIKSAAKDAVAAPLASLNDKVDALTTTTLAGGGANGGATTTTTGGGGANGGGSTTTTTPGGGGGVTTTIPTATTTTTPTFATPFGNPADFQLGFGVQVGPGASQDFDNPFSSTFAVTDMVLQNPNGDTGLVQIKRDGNILLQSALENFRDLDLHFVAPYMFNPGSKLTMSVSCTTPGPVITNCTISGSFGGFQK
ncbi:MAG: COG1470 family protein [Ilumatobacteraceae bacterium]